MMVTQIAGHLATQQRVCWHCSHVCVLRNGGGWGGVRVKMYIYVRCIVTYVYVSMCVYK